MAHEVTVNEDNVEVGGSVYDAGAVVVVTDETYDALVAADRFSDGTLTDGAVVPDDDGDAVYTQSASPGAPAALTAVPAVAAPTKAEYDALLADVTALRGTVADLITALTGAGKPLS